MITLYTHQAELLAEVKAALSSDAWSRVCMQLPTGAGKTVIAGKLIEEAKRDGRRIMILVHRRELVAQFQTVLDKAGLDLADIGLITAGRAVTVWQQFQICSVQTLNRRLKADSELAASLAPDLIIVDEAHHARAKTWTTILHTFINAKVLGMTATPQRLDGKGLVKHFDTLICGLSCLLYTSPSPRDRTRSRMPSSA